MLTTAILLAAALAPPAKAVDFDIAGPTEVQTGQLVRLEIDGHDVDGASVWTIYPPVGVDLADTAQHQCQFVAPAGKYWVSVVEYVPSDGRPLIRQASTAVTIGPADPTPPCPPSPDNPDPPDPPEPTPPTPPPIPVDPLAVDLAALYAADGEPTKALDLAYLTELYLQAEAIADDPTIGTKGELFRRLSAPAESLTRDRLAGVRDRIGGELLAVLGKDPDKTFTPAGRTKAKALFLRIYTALKEIDR